MKELTGWGTALALLLVAFIIATLPITIAPVLVVWFWPSAEWLHPFQWWWPLAGALIFGTASFLSVFVEATFRIMFPRPSQKWVLDFAGELATVLVFAFAYSFIMQPIAACLFAATVAWLVITLLDKATPEYTPRSNMSS